MNAAVDKRKAFAIRGIRMAAYRNVEYEYRLGELEKLLGVCQHIIDAARHAKKKRKKPV